MEREVRLLLLRKARANALLVGLAAAGVISTAWFLGREWSPELQRSALLAAVALSALMTVWIVSVMLRDITTGRYRRMAGPVRIERVEMGQRFYNRAVLANGRKLTLDRDQPTVPLDSAIVDYTQHAGILLRVWLWDSASQTAYLVPGYQPSLENSVLQAASLLDVTWPEMQRWAVAHGGSCEEVQSSVPPKAWQCRGEIKGSVPDMPEWVTGQLSFRIEALGRGSAGVIQVAIELHLLQEPRARHASGLLAEFAGLLFRGDEALRVQRWIDERIGEDGTGFLQLGPVMLSMVSGEQMSFCKFAVHPLG